MTTIKWVSRPKKSPKGLLISSPRKVKKRREYTIRCINRNGKITIILPQYYNNKKDAWQSLFNTCRDIVSGEIRETESL